jgi:hypothetical protein
MNNMVLFGMALDGSDSCLQSTVATAKILFTRAKNSLSLCFTSSGWVCVREREEREF